MAGSSKRSNARKKQNSKEQKSDQAFDMTNLSQAVIDTQAREAIKDLFPKIPMDDIHVIVGRAFQKVGQLYPDRESMLLSSPGQKLGWHS